MLSVKGIYSNGRVEPLEPVPFKDYKKVIITFIDEEMSAKSNISAMGALNGKFDFTDEEIKDAKKIWERS